jgi:predicted transcriptional regulator
LSKTPKPSDLEMQVLSVLWRNGPSTVRQVLEAMPDGKARAYTTILSVMQVMEKKGLLSHTKDGVSNVYEPKESQRRVLGPMLRRLVRNVFGGSASAAMQHLLSETNLSEEELAEIRDMLDGLQEGEREGQGGKSA